MQFSLCLSTHLHVHFTVTYCDYIKHQTVVLNLILLQYPATSRGLSLRSELCVTETCFCLQQTLSLAYRYTLNAANGHSDLY